MKPKNRRLMLIMAALLCLGGATAIILTVFSDNLVFFYSPTKLQKMKIEEGRRIRIGGLVEEESLNQIPESMLVEFKITDTENSVAVSYSGILPPMFREGQGIVAEGNLVEGVFIADNLLTKHDEKYMPPEVEDALKESGQWKGE